MTAWDRTEDIAVALIDMIKGLGLKDYHIAIEKPLNVRNKATSITLANCNGYLLGRLAPYTDGFTFIDNVSWCSYNLITGKRKERKKQSMEILASSGIVPLEQVNDDMADAYCILLYSQTIFK